MTYFELQGLLLPKGPLGPPGIRMDFCCTHCLHISRLYCIDRSVPSRLLPLARLRKQMKLDKLPHTYVVMFFYVSLIIVSSEILQSIKLIDH